jgi:hypothetical protein
MTSSGPRQEYSSRHGTSVPVPAIARWRAIAMSGTTPDPPATSRSGPPIAASQTKYPPIGPFNSSGSPTATTWVRYGETSPSSRRSTVISTRGSSGAEAME